MHLTDFHKAFLCALAAFLLPAAASACTATFGTWVLETPASPDERAPAVLTIGRTRIETSSGSSFTVTACDPVRAPQMMMVGESSQPVILSRDSSGERLQWDDQNGHLRVYRRAPQPR